MAFWTLRRPDESQRHGARTARSSPGRTANAVSEFNLDHGGGEFGSQLDASAADVHRRRRRRCRIARAARPTAPQAARVEGYEERVAAWAESVVRTLDEADA